MRISDWSSDVCSSDLHLLSSLRAERSKPSVLDKADGWRLPRRLQLLAMTGTSWLAPCAFLPDSPNGSDSRRAAHESDRSLHREAGRKIGRASCRERVCKYVYISGVAVSLKKKKN